MFRISYCKSLTMYQFTEPPPLTLDIGCGSGFWALEAAKQWQVCSLFRSNSPNPDTFLFLEFHYNRI